MYLVYTYVAIFAVFTGLHLYGSSIKRDSLRAPTKPVILLAILGMYLAWVSFRNADPMPALVFAIITSWMGDVLLIPKGVKWFTIGGICFWISHFLFIYTYWNSGIEFGRINPIIIIAIALVYFVAATITFKYLKKSLPKQLFVLMYLYLLTNGAMNSFAWFRLLSGACSPASGIATAVGALCFYISDSTLFFVRFDKNSRIKSHFWVMLTYSLGEFLIVLGLMLLV
ncbi:MAG: lysoplasmalogenase [Clostridiales bacterium]|nr:lysoplasmalogenase [Candidatus Crickella caballi]